MAKQLRAVVDDGTREVPLLNKFGKLICNVYFRPGDIAIVDRYQALSKRLPEILKPLEEISIERDGSAANDADWDILQRVTDAVKAEFNTLFDMEEADDIFATRAPFASVGGEFFCTRVLQALQGVINDVIHEEADLSQKRMSKYLSDLPKR